MNGLSLGYPSDISHSSVFAQPGWMSPFFEEELIMKTEAQIKECAEHDNKGYLHMPTQKAMPMIENTDANLWRQRNGAARQLLQEWLADRSGYDEETWPILKQGLEESRSSSNRRLFRD